MADDIDDLLDEVETKYIPTKNTAVGSKRAKPTSRNKLDDDISDILADSHLDAEVHVHASKPVTPARESSTKTVQRSGQKCLQVYLGGSSDVTGWGTAISQLTCDQLRCTACDFRVCLFDNFKWAADTNYLFLRNNVPDFHKLKSQLSPSRGQRAYCCQCSWRTVKGLTALDDPELKWHCGKH
ncbi:cilia- and flagella-associated protein 418-like [Littorina saxatilis]|uniref:Cilia- and flagella-associated protein 418 n=1 Tax=Littorina saxatilis TaxID=31220 RepID=A0AAN9BWE1_9CAEN